MEIVINISEDFYNEIKTYGNISVIHKAVLDGTVLPENHGDLIDVNRKITVPVYDEEHEEYDDMVLTVLEALNKWSDEGVTAKDVVIPGIAPDYEEEIENQKGL